MNQWLLIGGMALITFAIRYILIALSGRIRLSDPVMRALGFVPPAVLTAIIAPAVLAADGSLDMSLGNPRLVGAIAAFAMGLWRQNLLLTIVGGMGIFWIWSVVGGG